MICRLLLLALLLSMSLYIVLAIIIILLSLSLLLLLMWDNNFLTYEFLSTGRFKSATFSRNKNFFILKTVCKYLSLSTCTWSGKCHLVNHAKTFIVSMRVKNIPCYISRVISPHPWYILGSQPIMSLLQPVESKEIILDFIFFLYRSRLLRNFSN